MAEKIQACHRTPAAGAQSPWDSHFTKEWAEKVRNFHKTIPGYAATPLADLSHLARQLGVKSIHVKDESYRFGLNAFKGLGGSFCLARYIGEKLGIAPEDLTFETLTSPAVHEKIKDLVFVTATDGNHGRGIAWTAHELGVKSVVFMPKGSAQERLQNIRALGSDASITDMNYDDTVRYARKMGDEKGWVLVQDTAWDGYETIPSWIMQGYMTMALEAVEALPEAPTHVFLQAGVGAMSGAVTGFLANYYGDHRPIITIVEPDQADCLFRTATAGDGQLHAVTGSLHTIMAGLACGEPCTIGWAELGTYASHFISMPDYVAAKGMRVLGNPLRGDDRVISGESGAATTGFVAEVLMNPALADLKTAIGLDSDSRILCFSTEGDTDKENYRKIVWDGAYPSF